MNYRVPALILLGCALLIGFASLQTNPAERNNTGNALYRQAELEAAIRAYQDAQVNAPDQPEAYYNVAGPLSDTGLLRDAAAALEQALKTADDDLAAAIYYNLGNIYFQMARYGEAVDAYRVVLIQHPDDAGARYNYELALLRRIPTPTPTPQEQNIDPEEDETDSTPTPNPVGQEGPTPTPSPQPDSPPDEQATPRSGATGDLESSLISTPIPAPDGSLSIDDVERQLDAIQENQQTLREFLLRAATPSRPNGKDW